MDQRKSALVGLLFVYKFINLAVVISFILVITLFVSWSHNNLIAYIIYYMSRFKWHYCTLFRGFKVVHKLRLKKSSLANEKIFCGTSYPVASEDWNEWFWNRLEWFFDLICRRKGYSGILLARVLREILDFVKQFN